MTDGDSNVVALMPWDQAVRRAKQKHRALELLDKKDADQAIRALSEVEAYYAVKELGLLDATWMLALLEERQIQAILDLDVWHKDVLDRSDLLVWLEAFREAGLEPLQRAARSLDPEALAVLFARRLLITLKPGEDRSDEDEVPGWAIDPPEEIEPLAETPDGRFILAARAYDEDERKFDEEERKSIFRIIEGLYRDEDWERVAGILRMAMTDSPTDLEEDALRFRNGRIEDFGFAPFERAIEVYGPRDPSVLSAPVAAYPATDLSLPALHAGELAEGLFHQAMSAIADREVVRRVEGDLLPLANEVLVADQVEPGALEAIREVLLALRGYLEVGLAWDAEPSEWLRTASERLRAQPVRTIFQVGYGLTLKLKTRALRLIREERFFSALAEEDRALLRGLTGRRPRVAGSVFEGGDPDALLPFSAEAYARIEPLLTELEELRESQGLLLPKEEVDGRVEPPPPERTLDLWLTTAAARSLLGAAFEPLPLTAGQIADLADRLPSAADRRFDSAHALAALPPLPVAAKRAVSRRVAQGLDALSEVLWPLVGKSEIDPRFVEGVVRRLD